MPKIVNHEERRTEVADAVLDIIAESGVAGVTIRRVAETAGWSSGVIQHYFGNRHHLLLSALQRAAELSAEATEGADLEAVLSEALPLDRRRLAMSRIFLFFYAEAATDAEVRAMVVRYLDAWRADVRAALPARSADAADALIALVDGAAIHATVDPGALARLRVDNPLTTWIHALTDQVRHRP